MKNAKKIFVIIAILLCPFLFINAPKAKAATDTSVAGIVSTNGSNLNIRSSASTSSSILAKAPNKSYLTLISQSGSWWKIEYENNKYGYVSGDYIQKVNSKPIQVSTNGSNLNVRTAPQTSATKLTSLPNNSYLVELSRENNWSKVLYHGSKIGYVSSTYVKEVATYPSISLNVTSYKQFDTRWANIQVGNSGQTLQQIGCTTTALAMTESYRLQTAITPAEMVKKLSYTSGGAVYWPSHYSAYTKSDYLSKLYSLLKSGKTALIGSKNAQGKQHWVVVTGFTGGNSLTTSGFTIHDPGSSSRTTLNQFFSSYPNFYKIMYY